jgi:transposase
LVLVIDNASHHRTRAILDSFDDHADRCVLLWPPRCAPELNMIEGLWPYPSGRR